MGSSDRPDPNAMSKPLLFPIPSQRLTKISASPSEIFIIIHADDHHAGITVTLLDLVVRTPAANMPFSRPSTEEDGSRLVRHGRHWTHYQKVSTEVEAGRIPAFARAWTLVLEDSAHLRH
jgi:hypothetical protein